MGSDIESKIEENSGYISKFLQKANKFYSKNLSKNLLLGFGGAWAGGVLFAEFSDKVFGIDIGSTFASIIGEYVGFYSVFGPLMYKDCKKENKKFWPEFAKLLPGFAGSDAIYWVTKGFPTYIALESGLDPWKASTISYLISHVIYFHTMNCWNNINSRVYNSIKNLYYSSVSWSNKDS